LYGYLNGLDSKKEARKECARNIELQWLLCAYDFEEQSPSGLKTLFKTFFVSFLKDADLIGCKIIAIDGTKSKRTTARKFQSKKKIEDI
jgi:transposase